MRSVIQSSRLQTAPRGWLFMLRRLTTHNTHRPAATRRLRRAESRQHHRQRSNAATRAYQHELVRIVERVMHRRLIRLRDFAFDTPRALQRSDGAAGVLDDELPYAF